MPTYYRRDDFLKSPLGLALAGAQVYVCTQPATTSSVPPSPLATIYSTEAGDPITQPLIADGFGHTFFYANPTVQYTVVAVYSGAVALVLADQTIASGASGSVSPGAQYAVPWYPAAGSSISGSGLSLDSTGQALLIAPATDADLIDYALLSVVGDPGGSDLFSLFDNSNTILLEVVAQGAMAITPDTGAGQPALAVGGAGDQPTAALYANGSEDILQCLNGSLVVKLSVDHTGNLSLLEGIKDHTGSLGTSGYLLSSTGTQVTWVAASGSPGGSSGNLQWNSSGSFAGASGSVVDSHGDVALYPSSNSSSGGTLIVVGETGKGQPVANFYASDGSGGQGTQLLTLYQSSTANDNRIYMWAGVVINGYLQDSAGDGSFGTSGQVLTSTGTQVLWANVSTIPPAINSQSGNYIAALSDAQNIVQMTDASACTFTVPTNASVAFPTGSILTVIQYGAGQVTLTPAGGVTINNPSSLTTRAQYSTVSVTKVATNTWVAGGDLT
jgi:hypothetical protein